MRVPVAALTCVTPAAAAAAAAAANTTAGHAYPCFCTDAELEAMKAEAEAKKLPPIYRCGGCNMTVEQQRSRWTRCSSVLCQC